jgi:hypothetical protein
LDVHNDKSLFRIAHTGLMLHCLHRV